MQCGSPYLICVVYIAYRRVAERLSVMKGKNVEGSGCGLIILKLGMLSADNKSIFIGIGYIVA
jgi:hypothetical protein